MFYSMLHRPVTDLFGVFNKHSPFVFLSSHFEKQNDEKKKRKLGGRSDEPYIWGPETNQIFASFMLLPEKKKKSSQTLK